MHEVGLRVIVQVLKHRSVLGGHGEKVYRKCEDIVSLVGVIGTPAVSLHS